MIENLACIVASYAAESQVLRSESLANCNTVLNLGEASEQTVYMACNSNAEKVHHTMRKNVNVLDPRYWVNICGSHIDWSELINANLDIVRINYMCLLCSNPAPWVRPIILANLEYLDMRSLIRLCECAWSNVIDTRINMLDAKCWSALCRNAAQWVEPILIANPEKVDVRKLCDNRAPWVPRVLVHHIDKLSVHDYACLFDRNAWWLHSFIAKNLSKLSEDCLTLMCRYEQDWIGNLIAGKIDKKWLTYIVWNRANWAGRVLMNEQLHPREWVSVCLCSAPWVERLVTARASELDKNSWAILCRRCDRWIGPVITANLSKMNSRCWNIICQNKSAWVEPIVKGHKLSQANWKHLCTNPANWVHGMLADDLSNVHTSIEYNTSIWSCEICAKLNIFPKKIERWEKWVVRKESIVNTLTRLQPDKYFEN